MIKILFQGDSVTDVCRNREDDADLGHGYPYLIANRMGLEEPGRFQFYNRGIAGNKSVDIYARIKRDLINLQPDILTLLMGMNDVSHELERCDGTDTEKFKKIYRAILEETYEKLPNVKIILLEPFVLKGTATEHKIEAYKKGVAMKARCVRELVKEYQLPFVEFQKDLDNLEQQAVEGYWLMDGVHPTGVFHQYMADKLLPFIKDAVRAYLGE